MRVANDTAQETVVCSREYAAVFFVVDGKGRYIYLEETVGRKV